MIILVRLSARNHVRGCRFQTGQTLDSGILLRKA